MSRRRFFRLLGLGGLAAGVAKVLPTPETPVAVPQVTNPPLPDYDMPTVQPNWGEWQLDGDWKYKYVVYSATSTTRIPANGYYNHTLVQWTSNSTTDRSA